MVVLMCHVCLGAKMLHKLLASLAAEATSIVLYKVRPESNETDLRKFV